LDGKYKLAFNHRVARSSFCLARVRRLQLGAGAHFTTIISDAESGAAMLALGMVRRNVLNAPMNTLRVEGGMEHPWFEF